MTSRGHREGRSDELSVTNFRPITYRDLQQLQTIRQDLKGPVSVRRSTVANFLAERDILIFVAESARWLLEEATRDGLERKPRDLITPTRFEKAMGATRQAIHALDGIEEKNTESNDGQPDIL